MRTLFCSLLFLFFVMPQVTLKAEDQVIIEGDTIRIIGDSSEKLESFKGDAEVSSSREDYLKRKALRDLNRSDKKRARENKQKILNSQQEAARKKRAKEKKEKAFSSSNRKRYLYSQMN